MGRRAHKPDPTSRRQVEAMAGYGVPEADIAGVIGVDPKTLRKHYRDELKNGHVKATGEGRESVIAAIFWLKTRAGWKETAVHEVTGRDGGAIEVDSTSARLLLQQRITALSTRIQPSREVPLLHSPARNTRPA